jgi:hypothetical protein
MLSNQVQLLVEILLPTDIAWSPSYVPNSSSPSP